ncbi:hypothetical protein BDV12DRAFT_161456 [Aspergillus spectabilis]
MCSFAIRFFFRVTLRMKEALAMPKKRRSRYHECNCSVLLQKSENFNPSKDPRLVLPLLALGPMSIIWGLYCNGPPVNAAGSC